MRVPSGKFGLSHGRPDRHEGAGDRPPTKIRWTIRKRIAVCRPHARLTREQRTRRRPERSSYHPTSTDDSARPRTGRSVDRAATRARSSLWKSPEFANHSPLPRISTPHRYDRPSKPCAPDTRHRAPPGRRADHHHHHHHRCRSGRPSSANDVTVPQEEEAPTESGARRKADPTQGRLITPLCLREWARPGPGFRPSPRRQSPKSPPPPSPTSARHQCGNSSTRAAHPAGNSARAPTIPPTIAHVVSTSPPALAVSQKAAA